MSDPLTQQRFPRYQIELPVLHKIKPPAPIKVGVGWTRDLSEGGSCVELSEHFEPLTPLRVSLQTDQGAIEADAQVVWTKKAGEAERGVLHGVAFTHIPSEQVSALRNLLLSKGDAQETGVRLPLRLSVTCRVKGQAGVSLQGRTGDMSRRGLSLRLPQSLSPGTVLEITLNAPSGPLTAEGVIVWEGQQDQGTPGESLWHGVRLTAVGWTTPLSLGLYLAEPM